MVEFERQERARAEAAPTEVALVKAKGISFGSYWSYTITDEDAIPREYLKVDHEKLRAVVRALKSDTKIPGIEVWERPQVGARGG